MPFSRITSVVKEHPCTTSSAGIGEGRGTRGERGREGEDAATSSPSIPIPSSSSEFVAIEAKRRGEEEDGREGGNEENPGSLIHFVESAAESGNIF